MHYSRRKRGVYAGCETSSQERLPEKLGQPGYCALLVRRDSGKRALTLLVCSVKETASQVALILILDSSLPFRTTEADLYQLYRLTPPESRLGILLMEGWSLKDCCSKLGVCFSAGQAELKRIFRKTSVRSQNQLVSLLIKTVGLARLGI